MIRKIGLLPEGEESVVFSAGPPISEGVEVWVARFDEALRAIRPTANGWQVLMLRYHVLLGDPFVPFEVTELGLFLRDLRTLDGVDLSSEAREFTESVIRLLERAIASGAVVWARGF